MAYTKWSEKRRLDEVRSHYDVSNEPGVYIFYETIDGPPRYVGRSDTGLFERIRGRNYRYYQFTQCMSIAEAYYKECELWHELEDTIDNSPKKGGIHPHKPHIRRQTIEEFFRCPVCGK